MSVSVETPPSPITPVTPNPPLSTIPESLTTAPTPGISQPPPTASDDAGTPSSHRASKTSSQPASEAPITFKKEDHPMPWKDPSFAQKYKTAEIVTGHFARKLIEQTGLLATATANPPDPEKTSSSLAGEATGLTPLRILDNACGTGVVSKILYEGLDEERKKGLEVVCGDFSESMVEFVFKRINEEGWEGARGAVVDAQVRTSTSFFPLTSKSSFYLFLTWRTSLASLSFLFTPVNYGEPFTKRLIHWPGEQKTDLPDNHFTHVITNFAIMGMPDGIGALKGIILSHQLYYPHHPTNKINLPQQNATASFNLPASSPSPPGLTPAGSPTSGPPSQPFPAPLLSPLTPP